MNSGIFYSYLSDHLPIFQVTHLKLDAKTPCRKRLARLINPAAIAAFRSKLETIDCLLPITLTLPMTPMTHSLVFLFQHIISHFHLNPYTLNPGILLNPGFQKVSLYPVTGRILFTNNSKQTLLNPTNLDITSIEISTIFSLELLGKNIFMTN